MTFLSYCVYFPSFCLVSVWYHKHFWAWWLVAVEIGTIENWHYYYYHYYWLPWRLCGLWGSLCRQRFHTVTRIWGKTACHYRYRLCREIITSTNNEIYVSISVGLFVLLLTLWKNRYADCQEVFWISWKWYTKQLGTFLECSWLPSGYRSFFILSKEFVSLSNMTEKRTDFH